MPKKKITFCNWVSHLKAFEMLGLGDRYQICKGKKINSYAWQEWLKKLNSEHPFENIKFQDHRRLSRKSRLIYIVKQGNSFPYPRFERKLK
jgi:hypothetical protein